MEQTRIDKWLWAIRIYPTRTAATDACNGGHVRLNGNKAKPAATTRVGDRVEARAGDRDRVVEVVRVIDKRVSAAIASECFVDNSPPPPAAEFAGPTFVRDRATGRPTKRDRRQMDRFRAR